MKKHLLLFLALILAVGGFAQGEQKKKAKKEKTYNEKGEIIKKGWNFGPLPVVGFDADLGFQYGLCCDIFNYGDGSRYPKYDYKFNVEASRYTKGSGVFRFYSDMPYVVKDTKLFFDVTYFYAKKYEFFGFNGFEASTFDPYAGLEDVKSGYHFINRNQFRFVGSMQRPFFHVPNLNWTAGLAYYNTKVDRINLEGYEGQVTLYENYVNAGIIKEDEAHGGSTAQLRLGLVYDSRDHNSDPTRGIYAEYTFVGSTDWLGGNNGYNNLSETVLWRHYIPVYRDKLTFAYRLGLQHCIVGSSPWYMINNLNTMFFQKMYTEGLGGSVTLRGVNRNGVLGEGFAFGNLEMRWRIVGFQLINQNWQVALNPFFDAGAVIQPFREEEMKKAQEEYESPIDPLPGQEVNKVYYSGDKESLHMAAGCGLKLIMNRNLVVSVDLGKALDKRDGEKLKTFIGFNYVF
ncbi:MAG: BamA/TamA family outer membrane protein [Bacteroidales bacterium]|nr:BamA/TamA family outer membrane protein [Bacteroidales bacterium]